MRILVTGGRGFLGTALVRELHERWPGALVVRAGEYPPNDVRDPEVVERMGALKPDIVFHLAAQHFVPWCREHPRETLQTNAFATDNLLRACADAKTFVLASSAAVYGVSPFVRANSETQHAQPDDVYGLSKLVAETMLQHAGNGRRIAARLFNLVGLNDPVPHLFPIIYRNKGSFAPLDLHALKWARDFTHVDDAARSLVDLAAMGPGGYTAVNVCTGRATTGWDLVKMYNVSATDNPDARRAGGGHLIGSTERLRALTGRVPGDPFERLGGQA